jgi:hypothetical protein
LCPLPFATRILALVFVPPWSPKWCVLLLEFTVALGCCFQHWWHHLLLGLPFLF